MVSSISRTPLFFLHVVLLSVFVLLAINPVQCADEASNLLQSINSYRTSQNLTTFTKNSNAECLAQKIADQFKDQPCTNTSGASTVPGTEPQFSDYPKLLSSCHLNVTITRDGEIMPACIPKLDPTLVLNNYTKTQYSEYLNDTKFTGIGIGSDNDWVVVILTTSTSEGSFVDDNAASLTTRIGLVSRLLILFVCSLFMF